MHKQQQGMFLGSTFCTFFFTAPQKGSGPAEPLLLQGLPQKRLHVHQRAALALQPSQEQLRAQVCHQRLAQARVSRPAAESHAHV